MRSSCLCCRAYSAVSCEMFLFLEVAAASAALASFLAMVACCCSFVAMDLTGVVEEVAGQVVVSVGVEVSA